MPTTEQAKPFIDFVVARHRVTLARACGKQKPWTADAILQQYRFCNVYRELDTVTRHIRNPFTRALKVEDSLPEDIWFAMVVARMINWPSTLDALVPALRGRWRGDVFVRTMQGLMAAGAKPVFGPAYIVSTNGMSMGKAEYLEQYVLTPLWADRQNMRPQRMETLASYHARLMARQGLGSFMAAQVVADVKNTRGAALDNAPDWMTWAAPGPGSLRGLSRVLGRGALRTGWKDEAWLAEVNNLQKQLNKVFVAKAWNPLCAQDTQNCLCEFDKYERVRLGEGRPKQLYDGGRNGADLF